MKLLATSVVRGDHRRDSDGSAYLLDLAARDIREVIRLNSAGGHVRGRDGGLRGIAFDGGTVYLAGSEELLAFTRDFRPVGSWRNTYLRQCHALAAWERRLFLASADFDAILGFDLDRQEFNWAIHVVTQHHQFQARGFDPRDDNGPLPLNKLHLNGIHCTQGGMYLAGLRTGGMLLFNGKELRMAVELPSGSRDARPFRNGVLFNDSEAGLLRYSGRDGAEDRAFRVPEYPPNTLVNRELEQAGIARPGFARGLVVLSDSLVAGGSSPATVSVYDLPRNERLLSVNLTMDVSIAIHSLATWPY